MSPPPILVAPVFAALFYVMAAALGRRGMRWFALSSCALNEIETLLLQVTLGLTLMPAIPLALAAFHVLSPLTLMAAALSVGALLVPDALQVAKSTGRVLARARARTIPRAARVWLCLVALLLGTFLMHAVTLDPFGDDDGYHLSAPARFLREGTLSYLPSYTHTNAGLSFEMSYMIALAFGAARVAKLFHYGAGILTLVGVVCCARRLGDWAAGLAGISLLLITTPLLRMPLLFRVAYADFAVALTTTVAILVWLAWRESRDDNLLWCLALCVGSTAATKFTALAAAGAWCLVVVYELRQRELSPRARMQKLAAFAGLAALPVAPWLIRNWLVTGNPLYPMAAALIPTRDWSAEQAQIFARYIRYFAWGTGAGASLGEAQRRLILQLTAAVVGAGSFVAWRSVREPVLRVLLVLGSLSTLACIALTGLVSRYWLPGFICWLLVAGAWLWRKPWARGRLRFVPALALLPLAFAALWREELREGRFGAHVSESLGLGSDAYARGEALAQVWSYVHARTSPEASILVGAFYSSFGASSFGCFASGRKCFTTDSHLQTYIDLRTWDDFVRSVTRADIQYLLLSDHLYSPHRQGFSYRAGDNEYPFCVRLAREYGTRVFQAEHLQLFRLSGLAAGSVARSQQRGERVGH